MLLLVQITGLIVPFVLLHPIATTDFLAKAAGSAAQIKLAVLLLLANCALTIGLSVVAFPLFRAYSLTTAVLLVAVGVLMFALQAVDNAHLMSMLALSQEYVEKGGQAEYFQTLSAVVRAARRWVHYSELLAIDAWICVLYSLLYRFTLVPRLLAIFGLFTVLLHFLAIPLPLILGYKGLTPLGMPMAVSHIALALWLLVKGFQEPIHSIPAKPSVG